MYISSLKVKRASLFKDWYQNWIEKVIRHKKCFFLVIAIVFKITLHIDGIIETGLELGTKFLSPTFLLGIILVILSILGLVTGTKVYEISF